MVSVPAKLTAYQGFDALFHSTEGYINRRTNPLNDMYALKAIELVEKVLPLLSMMAQINKQEKIWHWQTHCLVCLTEALAVVLLNTPWNTL